MSPKKSPKTSKPAPLFVLWQGTIRGPEVPKETRPAENPENNTLGYGSSCCSLGSCPPLKFYKPAKHVFSFGEQVLELCFPSLTDASKALYKEAMERGEGQGYRRGGEAVRKEMLDRLNGKGDDYDD